MLVESQTRGFFLHRTWAPPPYVGQDYKQNGFGEKRGMVMLNRLSGHKMGESYGARVGKAKISRGFQEDRESAGVERTRISRGFRKQREDCGTSGESFGVLDCDGLLEFNLRSAVSSCVAFSSCHSLLPFFIFGLGFRV